MTTGLNVNIELSQMLNSSYIKYDGVLEKVKESFELVSDKGDMFRNMAHISKDYIIIIGQAPAGTETRVEGDDFTKLVLMLRGECVIKFDNQDEVILNEGHRYIEIPGGVNYTIVNNIDNGLGIVVLENTEETKNRRS